MFFVFVYFLLLFYFYFELDFEFNFNHFSMKNLLIILLFSSALYSCTEKELLEATPKDTVQVVEKSVVPNEYAEHADVSYLIDSETDFESMLATLNEDDAVVVLNSTAYVFYGLAPMWLDPGTIEGKEVCEGLGGIPFIKCVVKLVKAGEKVLVWLDANGNYHAST